MRHASVLLASVAVLFLIASTGMAGEARQTATAPTGVAAGEDGDEHAAGSIKANWVSP